MKVILDKYDAAAYLEDDYGAQMAYALASYFDRLEKEQGVEIELDLVAIGCSWMTYDNLEDWKKQHKYAAELWGIHSMLDLERHCKREGSVLLLVWNDSFLIGGFQS
jgi:hypothetical protein